MNTSHYRVNIYPFLISTQAFYTKVTPYIKVTLNLYFQDFKNEFYLTEPDSHVNSLLV